MNTTRRAFAHTVLTIAALASVGAGRPKPTLVALPSLPGHDYHQAWAANDTGTVVGHAGHLVEDGAIPVPARWQGGGVEALDGPLVVDGKELAADGIAVGINNAGKIVGDIFPEGGRRAAVWDDETWAWHALPLPQGVFFAGARGVNNRGDVVGGGAGRAIVWRDGLPEVLPVPEGYLGCQGFAINDAGDVAGQCRLAGPSGQTHAVAWYAGVPTVLGGQQKTAFGRAINNPGLVVGHDGDYVDPNPPGVATAWDGEVFALAYPGAANGVNNGGEVAGYVGVNAGGAKAAYWADLDAAPVVFEPLEGDDDSWFRDINNPGLAVGFSAGPKGYTAVTARP